MPHGTTMRPAWSFAGDETIPVERDVDVACVQARAREFARAAGLSRRVQWNVAIVASELATNVLKYGPVGAVTLRGRSDPEWCLEIEAADRGQGFADVELALRDGVSEGRDHALEGTPHPARRGLGFGLGAVRRLTDRLVIEQRPGGGTVVTARIELVR